MSAREPVVAVDDVRWSYGHDGFGLDVSCLRIERGETVACIGPSGSGKTTLLALMAGLFVPERGSVRLEGRPLENAGERERRALRITRIGMVFQEFELLEYLTAWDNVLLPYHVSDALHLDAGVEARARELARAMGIEGTLGRKPARLSQGERQRVALCRALVTDPALLLCDEPTGNLDPKTSVTILDLLFERAREDGAAVFMVTHDHGLLERFDRVVDVRHLAVSTA